MGDLDGMVWYIDPVAACLIGILFIAVGLLISFDFLHVRIVRNGGVPWCDLCGCWHHTTAPHIGEDWTLTRESQSETVDVVADVDLHRR